MLRTTITIPNPSAPFGSNPSKEVYVPRMPMINKITGNLAGSHKKQRIANELEQVNEQVAYKVQYFTRKQKKQFNLK